MGGRWVGSEGTGGGGAKGKEVAEEEVKVEKKSAHLRYKGRVLI